MDAFRCLLMIMVVGLFAGMAMGYESFEEYQKAKDQSAQARKACEAVIEKYADSPELAAHLQKPLSDLIKAPYARMDLTELCDWNPEQMDAIFAALKKCDKVDVLNVLERIFLFSQDYSDKLSDHCSKLRTELIVATPKNQRLALAEKCLRPRLWAQGFADQFKATEPKRVEALYCRWSGVEIGPKGPSDPDENGESDESYYEEDLVNTLLEMDTPASIHAVAEGINRWGDDGEHCEYLTQHTIRKLPKSKQPEAMDAIWSVAKNPKQTVTYARRELAIIILMERDDLATIEQLIVVLNEMDPKMEYEPHIQMMQGLKARKAELMRKASTRPATTQPASTQSAAMQPAAQ